MAAPFKAIQYDVVSGGAYNPTVTSGVSDPSSAGKSAPEGSIYLRYVSGTGEVWYKTAAADTDWTKVGTGGGGGTLQDAYNAGSSITAGSGPVVITASVNAGLQVNISGGQEGLDVNVGDGATTGLGFSLAGGAGTSRAITVADTVAQTVPAITVTRSINGSTGANISLVRLPGTSTLGNALDIQMGASADGRGVKFNSAGSPQADLGFSLRASDPSVPVEGDFWYNTTNKVLRYYDGTATVPVGKTLLANTATDIIADVVPFGTLGGGNLAYNSALRFASADTRLIVGNGAGSPTYTPSVFVNTTGADADVTLVRDSGAELEIYATTAGGGIGLVSDHTFVVFANDTAVMQFNASASAAVARMNDNDDILQAPIFELTNVGGGTPTGLYMSFGFGSTAPLSAASTGRIRYNESTQKLQYSNNGGAYADIGSGSGGGITIGDAITSGTANRILYEDASNQLAESANLSFDGSSLGLKGTLVHSGATSGALTHQVPATVTSYAVTWPSAQASGTQYLSNDGAGNLSWATPSSTDANAIHDNVAAEISAITEKATPVSADLLLIEDSADSNNKKRVQVGNLPGGAGEVAQYVGSGRWEYVESKEATSAVASLTFDGLDGDVEEEYLLKYYVPITANDDIVLRPNGATTNFLSQRSTMESSRLSFTDRLILIDGGTSAYKEEGELHFFAQRSIAGQAKARYYVSLSSYWSGASAMYSRSASGEWNETATNLTSLVIAAESGSPNIPAGSKFDLYRKSTNLGNAVSPGTMEYMDTIEVTAATQTLTFGAGGDGVMQRPLDGDVDETYLLHLHLVNNSGGTISLNLQPNGITSNQRSQKSTENTSGVYTDESTVLRFLETASPRAYIEGNIRAKSGLNRVYFATGLIESGSGTITTRHGYTGVWEDTTTNVTTLELSAGGATDIGVGTVATLYRLTRHNLRADAASTYERNVEAVVAQGSAGPTTYTTGKAVFGGSALGIGVALIDDTVTSGTITVDFKVGGSTVLTAVLDSTNTSYHRAASPVGRIPVLAGDAIEVNVTTASLVTSGAGSPALSVNLTLSNDAFIQPSVSPGYLAAGLSADQTTNIAIGNHIEFDTSSVRGSSLALATGSGQADGLFTLQPGKTYEILANVRGETNEGHGWFQWTDDFDDSPLVDDMGLDAPMFHIADDGSSVTGDTTHMSGAPIVFTPSTETTIKLEIIAGRVVQTVNLVSISVDSRVLIKEL